MSRHNRAQTETAKILPPKNYFRSTAALSLHGRPYIDVAEWCISQTDNGNLLYGASKSNCFVFLVLSWPLFSGTFNAASPAVLEMVGGEHKGTNC